MRIRGASHRTSLRTDVERRQIIGGSADNSLLSVGYVQTDDGIRAMPSPVLSSPSVGMFSPYRLEHMNEPGATLYVNKYGQLYSLTLDDSRTKSKLIDQIPTGQFFTGLMYVNNNYTMAVGSGDTVLLIRNNSYYATYTLPRYLQCGCLHCGRLFGRDRSEPYTVRWSTTTSLVDWSESPDGAGYIVLDLHYGEIMGMYELGDKIIILRQHGITVLRALGDTRNFSVDAVMGCEISVPVENPFAVVCRGKLFFSTAEAIYSFDGSALERIVPERREKLSGFANPQCYEDRYLYFECVTAAEENYILEYDLDTGRTGLFCKDCNMFWRDKLGVHCFKNNVLYSTLYGNDDSTYLWQSEEYDLGTDEVKTLRQISVGGDGQMSVTVTADGVSRTFSGTGMKRVMLRGRKFSFSVSGNADVRDLSAEWEVSA